MVTSFELFSFEDKIGVAADEVGIRIHSNNPNIDVARKETWPAELLALSGAWKTAVQIEQLTEMGLGTKEPTGFLLPYHKFDDAIDSGINIVEGWVKDCPYLLKIDRQSDLGRPDFRYRYQLLEEGRPALYDRLGHFIRRVASQEIFRLDSQSYALLEAMDSFNNMPLNERTQQQSWLTFAKVKGCATEVGAALDSTLGSVDVVIPSTIGLDISEENGTLTFLPTCPEMGAEEFQLVFDRNSEVEGLYTVDRPGLGKVRIVLSDIQKEVLKRMKRVRRVSGPQKQSLLDNPAQVFDGVLDAVDLPYGERVIGIGSFVFTPVPRSSTGESEMSGLLRHTPDSADQPSPETLEGETASAGPRENGPNSVEKVPGSEHSVECPQDEATQSEIAPGRMSGETGKKFLLIDTNEESVKDAVLELARQAVAHEHSVPYQRPLALRADLILHPHQQAGIHWMQTCRRIGDRSGVLLADDMGLGKTLQILSFLAWAIETKSMPDVSHDRSPYRPILIVVPLILLENNTWEGEMESFFEGHGAIFLPVLKLHGKTVERLRIQDSGKETDIGRPVLDLDEIQRHRVVLTNYETLRNYQHSFAYVRNGKSLWSAIITDEAQEHKVPNSKISHAVKALSADFRIGSSGTPVENRLLDLWNIMDALQPGRLGSAREFTQSYETRQDNEGREESLRALREQLLIQKPHAFLLRRDKSQVTTLPKKTTEKLLCNMSETEVGLHMELLRELQRREDKSKFLVVLQRFARLYQHPSLVDGDGDNLSAEELITQSSKLRQVVAELHRIRGSREKVLIFARHVAVQSLLAKVLQSEFQIPVRIINGSTQRSVELGGANSRRAILDEFRARSGFNLIILSPFVAGIGLTITEANHVIHYGRWWNPAVESQATDRAYRIGQTKDVVVYLPILTDPAGRIPLTFDQRLDALMDRKYSLARDFLRPLPAEDELEGELHRDLMREAGEVR